MDKQKQLDIGQLIIHQAGEINNFLKKYQTALSNSSTPGKQYIYIYPNKNINMNTMNTNADTDVITDNYKKKIIYHL